MNILTDILPPAGRKYFYAAFALIGLILGACEVWGLDVTALLAVYGFVGTALGLTAYSNTKPPVTISSVTPLEVVGAPVVAVALSDGTVERHPAT